MYIGCREGKGMFNVQIVDDEPIIRMGIEKMLNWNALGFEIVCMAQNGKQALEQLEVEKIDVIITDIEMPIMNGLDFIKEVRQQEASTGVASREVVVLTAYEDFEYARTAIKYGIAEYVLKPVDIEEMTQILSRLKERLEERKSI